MRCLLQGHLDTLLGGVWDQTSKLPVTSQPSLPPEPHAAHITRALCVLTLTLCPPENARSDPTAGADPDHPDSPYPGGGARDDPEGVRRHPLILQRGG